jgi:hypothetical protein
VLTTLVIESTSGGIKGVVRADELQVRMVCKFVRVCARPCLSSKVCVLGAICCPPLQAGVLVPFLPFLPRPSHNTRTLQDKLNACDRAGGRNAALGADEDLESFRAIVGSCETGREVDELVANLIRG